MFDCDTIEVWKDYKTYHPNKKTVKSWIELSNLGNIKIHLWNYHYADNNIITEWKDYKCILNHHNLIYVMIDFLFRGPLPKGYVVHHKDENKSNNKLDNLIRMTKSEHTILHHTGKKAWNKGLTKETDERLKKQGESYKDNYYNTPHRPRTDEYKKQMSISLTGSCMYNNGSVCHRFHSEEEAIAQGYIYRGRVKKGKQ